METIKLILKAFTRKERRMFAFAFSVFVLSLTLFIFVSVKERSTFIPVAGGSYTEGIIGQPIMINPVLSENQTDKDISALIYSPLFSLLSDWKVSNDGREYTIKLKEGLMWDDGKPLTSDDVIFTIKTIQDPEARSQFIKSWQGITTERVSQLQIKISLPTPYIFFTENLKRLRPIPKHIFGAIPIENIRLSGYNLEPVGSGPYKFETFGRRKDGFITEYHLVKNEYYAGTKPYIERFSFSFNTTQNELLENFKFRHINGFGSTLPLGSEIQNLPRVRTEMVSMPRYYAIFMNTVNNPTLKDEKLRNALNAAINKERLINEVFKGRAAITDSPLFKKLISFEPQNALGTSTTPQWTKNASSTNSSYDVDTALRVIASSKTQNIKLNLAVPKVSFLEKAAELIREDWLAAGISEVDITTEDTNVLASDYIKTRNYELLLFGNIYENPADLFPFWHSSQNFYPGLNLSLYKNTEVDKLIEATRQKDDPAAQEQNLSRMETIIKNDNPALFLFSLPYFYAHSSQLAGFAPGTITTPEDRFRNVEQWSVAVARVMK